MLEILLPTLIDKGLEILTKPESLPEVVLQNPAEVSLLGFAGVVMAWLLKVFVKMKGKRKKFIAFFRKLAEWLEVIGTFSTSGARFIKEGLKKIEDACPDGKCANELELPDERFDI